MSNSLTRYVPPHTVTKTREYLAAGATQTMLSEAVAGGQLVRVRKGWYAPPGLHPDIANAFRVGGRLTGTSLARLIELPRPHNKKLRLWVPPSAQLHVAIPAHGSRLRTRTDHHKRLALHPDPYVCLHWNAQSTASDRCIVTLTEMLRDIISCEHELGAIAVLDSALSTGLLSASQFERFRSDAPHTTKQLLNKVDGRSESGLESIARVRGAVFGIRIRPQFRIGRHRVDLLLGDKLVVELAGFEHHSSIHDLDKDLQRAAEISASGYRILTFGYKQVLFRWHEVEDSVRAAIARGDHL